MKKNIPILVGLVLVCALGYALIGTSENVHIAEKQGSPKPEKRSAPAADGLENLLPGPSSDDVAYAIVVMPKSYLPALKRFSRSKMARDLKIYPARMGWNDGQLVVIPKQAVLKKPTEPRSLAEKADTGPEAGGTIAPPESKIVLRNVALLLLLQGSLSGKMTYNRNRTHSSASSNLHR